MHSGGASGARVAPLGDPGFCACLRSSLVVFDCACAIDGSAAVRHGRSLGCARGMDGDPEATAASPPEGRWVRAHMCRARWRRLRLAGVCSRCRAASPRAGARGAWVRADQRGGGAECRVSLNVSWRRHGVRDHNAAAGDGVAGGHRVAGAPPRPIGSAVWSPQAIGSREHRAIGIGVGVAVEYLICTCIALAPLWCCTRAATALVLHWYCPGIVLVQYWG